MIHQDQFEDMNQYTQLLIAQLLLEEKSKSVKN